MSTFGRWIDGHGLPVFEYTADPDTTPSARWDPMVGSETSRHWTVLGNRRVSTIVDNYGTVVLVDEHDGIRFLTGAASGGSGESLLDGERPVLGARRIGPMWFEVDLTCGDVALTRTVHLPEGEVPWLLVQVEVSNAGSTARPCTHTERWQLAPRFVTLAKHPDDILDHAKSIAFTTKAEGGRVEAAEIRSDEAARLGGLRRPAVYGAPHLVVLETVGGTTGAGSATQDAHPALEITTPLVLEAGTTRTLWFRIGLGVVDGIADPGRQVATWRSALNDRLPRADSAHAPMAAREVPWHAALLSGGACTDGLLGGHTLDQGSTYSYVMGFNGAARDPLQHAVPLVYTEPDLALSVLCNTCSWASPDGDLPYALDGGKRPWTTRWQPSDQNIWALWLATEYAAATGDLAAFDRPVGFHPVHAAEPVALREHLRRQLDFLLDGVGIGEHGHLRIRNADWNDVAISSSGVPHDEMVAKGESVLNSAMAAWVLPRYAGLCERLGDRSTALLARRVGTELRDAVAGEWNGRWFRRAYGPGVGAIGDDDLWLEGQPWAILCGAATPDQAAQLLDVIDAGPRSNSPLGARVRWPVGDGDGLGGRGEATNGGIWYSINATLVWAAASIDAELAWDEWRRMSLAAHETAYPDVWEGTVSGPDTYNAPESSRPGRTWGLPDLGVGMQAFPVGNLHSHAQPLLAYLRLLGVEPGTDGTLRVGGGARFESRVLTVEPDGSGRLHATGPVVVDTGGDLVVGGPGEVRW